MKKSLKFILLFAMAVLTGIPKGYSDGPLDPVKVGSWTINAGVGPATPFFGNGAGFGPAMKGSFETGMWDAGPGVITLGGETAFSFFTYHYGKGWNESWVNLIFAARGGYHYGWDVEGLDTYAGVPLGIGFSAHSGDKHPGSRGYAPVFPYAGIFFGASWFFNKSIGINGEVGYNSTYANIGVIFKLK